MKKIGIVTITIGELINTYNYGNKLQNYALQKYLSTCGYKPITILHRTKYPEYINQLAAVEKKILYSSLINIIERAKQKSYLLLHKRAISKREDYRAQKFKDFSKKYINFTDKEYSTANDYNDLNKICDSFVVGSDQIWNPYYEGTEPFAFLDFAPKEKRIAYAPSIGINYIPNEIKKSYIDWVKNIKYRSIREDSGRDLLLKYGIDNVKLVCDPVFLLEAEEWRKISSKPVADRKYFAIYILGGINGKTKKNIKRLEKLTGLKAIDIYNIYNSKSYYAGPSEFLSIIDNSQFLLTDSFHGMAFSVIFKKPFILTDRNHNRKKNKYDMSSRLESLSRLINSDNRNIDYLLNNPEKIYQINYSHEQLDQLINTSKEYLNNSLTKSLQKTR